MVLFNESIYYNILYGNLAASKDEVRAPSRLCFAQSCYQAGSILRSLWRFWRDMGVLTKIIVTPASRTLEELNDSVVSCAASTPGRLNITC